MKLGKGSGDGCFLSKANITEDEFWYAVSKGVVDVDELQWPNMDDPTKRDTALAKVPTKYIPVLRDMYGAKKGEWLTTRHKRKEPVQMPLNLFEEDRDIRPKGNTTNVINFDGDGQSVFPGASFAEAKFATLPKGDTAGQEMNLVEKMADLEDAVTKKFKTEVDNARNAQALEARVRALEAQMFAPS